MTSFVAINIEIPVNFEHVTAYSFALAAWGFSTVTVCRYSKYRPVLKVSLSKDVW